MLERHKLFGKAVRFTDGLRYREAIIEADEHIAVFGGGVREPDPDGGQRVLSRYRRAHEALPDR